MADEFEIPTGEEYFDIVRNREPSPAYIENIQPQEPGEYSIIAGKTGIGKTNLALKLAFCCSTGSPFFTYACDKTVTGFLSMEGDDRNMLSRYDKIKTQFPDPGSYFRYDKVDKASPAKMLKTVETKIKDLNIVILDGSRFLMSDYCDPKQSSEFVVEFMNMIKKKGAVAILTLQAKKIDSRYLLEPGDIFHIKGATDIVDGATSAMLLEHTPHAKSKNAITLYFAKYRISDAEMTDINLTFDKGACRFIVRSEGVKGTMCMV